ncbi:sensor histidine kinase [Clostridium sp. 1001271B_151109_B4]|uniref:sensor histidine kinase n=1 Tax=Clostridium sp. 1001271B_151109_B4 TaxID=2787148 RepID=UPI0018AAC981|nr:sensor histidine kinase [Clostridium sp. 1001271B_151109_B4]
MKIKFKHIIYLLILLLGLFFIAISIRYTNKGYTCSITNNFSKDWLLTISGTNIKKKINLPYYTKENTAENIISIEKQIPNDFIIDPYLRVGSSQQEIRVYLDDVLIYNFDSMRKINNGKTGGAVWLLVKLPKDCFGKTLKIEFISSYNKLSGNLSRVMLRSKPLILSELFFETLPKAILSFLTFILAFILLLASIFYKKVYGINFNGYYLSLIFLSIAIWIFSESQFFVFIFNNYSLIYFLQFISLFSFPVFLYKYIFLEYNLNNKKFIFIIYKIHIYILLIFMLLQFIGLSSFYLLQWIFILIFFITISICITIIILESKKNSLLKILINILIILFISFNLDSILYDFKSDIFNISFLSLGTLLTELYIFISILKNISNLKKIKEDNDFLKLQLDYQLKYYNYIKEKNSNIASYKHDMLNHWSTVYNLIDNNNIEVSKNYISNIIGKFSTDKKILIDTGNPVLDSILTEKLEIAKRQNIKLSTDIFINKNLKIDLLDCCIIFSNILDNAIEALSKVKNNKYLEIKLMSKGNILICKIINSIDKNVIINKNFKTSKKDINSHGMGLKNINTAIQKYDGELFINYDDFTFTVSFTLFNV